MATDIPMIPSAAHAISPDDGEVGVGVGAGDADVAVVRGLGVYVGGSEIVGVTEAAGVDGVVPKRRTLSIYPVA